MGFFNRKRKGSGLEAVANAPVGSRLELQGRSGAITGTLVFSSAGDDWVEHLVTLDDGLLMAYDLLTLERAPELVVLSACNSGMSRAPVEGAPLGLPGTFLAQGTSCVIAGMVPVQDEAARAVMLEQPASGIVPGALLLFRMRTGAVAKHCGIVTTPDRFVHAYERSGVVEVPLDAAWRRRVAFVFLFPAP